MVERVARQLQTRIEDNQPHYVAWNECSVQLVAAAKVHTFDTIHLHVPTHVYSMHDLECACTFI